MSDPMNTEEVKIWKMYLRAHAALMREMDGGLQRAHGISLTWIDVLVQLSLAEGQRLTHTRLSERMLVSGGGGITRLVDRMAKVGLVTRRASRKDRRVSYVVLTDEGKKKLDEVTPTQFSQVHDQFIRHLGAEEMPVIRDFLARLLGEDVS